MTIAEKPLPANLPAGFIPIRWEDWGSSLICRAAGGRMVRYWPLERLVQSMPRG
jgi:hypothetical protein